jgi:acyl carrier protein
MNDLELEIKNLIITALDLEDINIEDIDTDAELFGNGLGLDSIDALELGVAIQKKYKIKINGQTEETKAHFISVKSLALFISGEQIKGQSNA